MGEFLASLTLGSTPAVAALLQAPLAAFVFGQGVAWTYELTFRGASYSRGFNQSILLAALFSTLVVLALGQSLMAGLGLFGVLSMIRFRTTLKSSRDLLFVMASAASGLAAGTGALAVGAAG